MHKPLKERVRAGRWGRAADTLGHSAPMNLAGVSQKWPEGDGRDQEWLSLFHGSTPYCLWIMLRRVHHDFIFYSNSNAN
jgi:hypothetical protein